MQLPLPVLVPLPQLKKEHNYQLLLMMDRKDYLNLGLKSRYGTLLKKMNEPQCQPQKVGGDGSLQNRWYPITF